MPQPPPAAGQQPPARTATNGSRGASLSGIQHLTPSNTTPTTKLQQQQGAFWQFASYFIETTRDDRIRWYTFISQCVISVMIMAFAIAMLSKECAGPTSIYLTIITGILASYLPSTELYAKQRKGSSTPASPAARARSPSVSRSSSGSAPHQQPAAQPTTNNATAADATQVGEQQHHDVEQQRLPQQQQQQSAAAPVAPHLPSIDKEMSIARFAMLNMLSVIVLVLSFVKISQGRDAAGVAMAGQVVTAENTYLPVITAIHGFYMPPPGRKKDATPPGNHV